MGGWWRCWRACGRIARWRFEEWVVGCGWLVDVYLEGRAGEEKTVRFEMGGDEEYAAFFSFSFLVPALVFGGFDFLYWETEGGFCRFAQFVYFYEGVLAEKRLYKEEEEVLSLMIGLGQKSST